MRRSVRFALNHIVAPRTGIDAFFGLAKRLGIHAVEIRNDLEGTAIGDGTPAPVVRSAAERHGVRILSVNALQRFNDWTSDRAAEACDLADYAATCGAEALVLCPVNDSLFRPDEGARLEGLRGALSELLPLLAARNLKGLVEPLGFSESSLRLKQEAVDAIAAVGGSGTFRLVHDTFHHAISGEATIFAGETALVHISGVEEAERPFDEMRDAHRVLVGPRDRLDNIGQVEALLAAGYAGSFSYEPFAESIHNLSDIASALKQSAAYLRGDTASEAAA
jgi:2-keto-myo-inositol isomerase